MIQDDIIVYLKTAHPDRFGAIGPETSLLGDGRLDSMAILDLVQKIEALYDLALPDEELSEGNFLTVRAVVAMVKKLKPES